MHMCTCLVRDPPSNGNRKAAEGGVSRAVAAVAVYPFTHTRCRHGRGNNATHHATGAKRAGTAPAFTLIEMMIAISLGLVLIYAAIAGFRVASQSITNVNRLSQENELMRAGISMAHEQLDFWTNLDDPNPRPPGSPDGQQLRHTFVPDPSAYETLIAGQSGEPVAGLAFTPFSVVFPAGGNVPRAAPGTISGAPVILQGGTTPPPPSWEQDTGFDPTYAWCAHDPRTWFRGNPCEKLRSNPSPSEGPIPYQWFGRYGIFTNTDVSPSYITYSGLVDPVNKMAYDASFTSSPGEFPAHLWYGRQVRGLSRAIGFYGMCDYLPSNAMYGAYGSYTDGRNTNHGGMTRILLESNGRFRGTGMGPTTMGIYAFSNANSFGVTNPGGRIVSADVLAGELYRHWDTDYNIVNQNSADLTQFMTAILPMEKILDSSPANWPVVTVGVAHFLKSGHFVNLAKVRWVSPLTGQLAELSFTGVGTTLRGARMQRRHPDSGTGWARWDNGPAAVIDRNLDSP